MTALRLLALHEAGGIGTRMPVDAADQVLDRLFNRRRSEMERAELGVDGNCGFALLGEDLQSGEAEFVEIALPLDASKNPNRYHNSEWCRAAEQAASAAYRALKARLPDREFSYYIGPSHPRHLP